MHNVRYHFFSKHLSDWTMLKNISTQKMLQAKSIMFTNKRMNREASTIKAMIRIYCHHHHGTKEKLCRDCDQLLRYAFVRLKNCPFQEKKTTCGKCPIHCYKPEMRQKIKEVMRYVGPRMMLHHPIMGLMHTLDGFRKPSRKGKPKPSGK